MPSFGRSRPSGNPLKQNLKKHAPKHAAEIFKQYDHDGDGTLNRIEFKRALQDLGHKDIDGQNAREVQIAARAMFDEADVDGTKRLDLDEFIQFYMKTMAEEYQKRDESDDQVRAVVYVRHAFLLAPC